MRVNAEELAREPNTAHGKNPVFTVLFCMNASQCARSNGDQDVGLENTSRARCSSRCAPQGVLRAKKRRPISRGRSLAHRRKGLSQRAGQGLGIAVLPQ